MKKILIVCSLFSCLRVFGQDAPYSTAQLKADLEFLHAALKKSHPGLYSYSTKEEIDAQFNSLAAQLPATMSGLEFYEYLTPLCAKIKDGHTLFNPAETVTAYHNENSRFFPFKIHWDGIKMFVALNYAATDEIDNGAEIVAINETPAFEIIEYCLLRMMRDGESPAYPIWVLNNWFNEYYSYFYGHPTEFAIHYRLGKGPIQTKTIQALSKKSIFENRSKRYPDQAFSRTADQKEGNGLVLKIDRELKYAILTIKDFDNTILEETYKQPFKKTIEQYFSQIEAGGVTKLILDLRNNQGGDVENGRLLLSWLMNVPFQLVAGYAKVNEPGETTEAKRNKPCKGPEMGVFQPKSRAFKGELYVLINGGSFSNSGMVGAALQFYKRGLLIGEETGGNQHLLCGNEEILLLPNTRISVAIPTLQYQIRKADKLSGHGVIPDIVIKPSIRELIKGGDEILNHALKLVSFGK
ncbi:MAG: S41 family peptidase [Saprospiraceae bacterium]|nr:S41 family peptidase [Saprospiraceae bacterium]